MIPIVTRHTPAFFTRTYCKKGHVWIPENIRIDNKGGRHCRICQNAAVRVCQKRYRAEVAALYL